MNLSGQAKSKHLPGRTSSVSRTDGFRRTLAKLLVHVEILLLSLHPFPLALAPSTMPLTPGHPPLSFQEAISILSPNIPPLVLYPP